MANRARANLTHQQKLFCIEYLKDLNQVQAAIRAGYSARSAQNTAWRVFALEQVQEYLQPLLQTTIDETLAEAKDVLKELPMEFAVEAQKLLSVSLEGSVG